MRILMCIGKTIDYRTKKTVFFKSVISVTNFGLR